MNNASAFEKLPVGNLPSAPVSIKEQMLTIELASMTNAAVMMAVYILAQPAHGMDQLSEVRMVASRVLAAQGPKVTA